MKIPNHNSTYHYNGTFKLPRLLIVGLRVCSTVIIFLKGSVGIIMAPLLVGTAGGGSLRKDLRQLG